MRRTGSVLDRDVGSLNHSPHGCPRFGVFGQGGIPHRLLDFELFPGRSVRAQSLVDVDRHGRKILNVIENRKRGGDKGCKIAAPPEWHCLRPDFL